MPRAYDFDIHIVPYDNLKPTLVDPRHNRDSIGGIVINRLDGKRVKLVHTGAVDEVIGQFQGRA